MAETVDKFLSGLRAAAESTRLRLLALCADGELTVSELTQILGQSQPRVSRHLRLLCEAGLLRRYQERTWAFYRLAERHGDGGRLARMLVAQLPADDDTLRLDRERLTEIKSARAQRAGVFFAENAAHWDEVRALYVSENEVEQALLALFADRPIADFLDIGTGTGRILELMAPRIQNGVGIDQSHAMLEMARASLDRAGFGHCQVRHGDMYVLPFADASFDAISIHMVLHYADTPGSAIREAARVLRSGGRLVVIDFAPHAVESLRADHAHRRLGFAENEVLDWFGEAGIQAGQVVRLPGLPLTVTLWTGIRSNVTELDRAGRAASVLL